MAVSGRLFVCITGNDARESILSPAFRIVDDAIGEIVDNQDCFPTVWALSVLTGLPAGTVFAILMSFQETGSFPFRIVTPINLPDRRFNEVCNLMEFWRLSGVSYTLVDLAEALGASPLEIVHCIRRNA